jgi:FixJ family two-component response regulator
MNPLTTVHLVDDDPLFLAATSRFVRKGGFAVATYASVADLLAHVSSETRGCVIADLVMPEIGGLELQGLLTERGVMMPVVFLTGHGDIPSTVEAMRSGAIDFLQKVALKEKLMPAIVRALKRDAEAQVERTKLEEHRRRFATLTEREREVLERVVRGKRNKQIAGDLGIAERTVKSHRAAIRDKLGVHSVAQLTLLASEACLGMDPPTSPRP